MTPSPQNVLFYAPSLGDGGAERLWAAMANQFHLAGHDVTFARDLIADDCRHLLHEAIPIETLGAGHRQSVRKLADVLKRTRPDVALTAVAASGPKLLLARALSGVSTKVIQSVHGHNEWKTGVASLLTTLAMPVTSRLAARTIAVSSPLRDRLISRHLAARDKTVWLPNPVVLPRPRPNVSTADLAQRPPNILAVGRLSRDKDYPTLIEAISQITIPDVHLTIVGKGPEEDALRQQIHAANLEARVTLAGYLDDPSPQYGTAKCLALTSRTETFGNVIVEALAHGLPVVATDTDGPRLILNSQDLGMRVPVRDAAALARALETTLTHPGDPAPRQQRAEAFSMEQRFRDYESLVDTVLARPASTVTKDPEHSPVRETNNVSG